MQSYITAVFSGNCWCDTTDKSKQFVWQVVNTPSAGSINQHTIA